MFEQSVVIRKNRPWTMALSLTLQCAAVGAIILWSIVYVEGLGPLTLPNPLPPFPRGTAVKVVDVQRSAGPVSAKRIIVERRLFTAPARIQSAAVAFAPIVEADAGPAGGGSGIVDGVIGAILNTADHLLRPPPLIAPPPSVRPAPPKPAPVQIGGNVLEAQIINRVMPEYPPLARQMRLSGVVQLVGIIDRDGSVKSLQVVAGHPMLVKAALAAVSQWKYRPTLLNREPVEVIAPITVNFTLTQ